MSSPDRGDGDPGRLFRQAMADVARIVSDRVPPTAPRPEPIPWQHRRDERAALIESLAAPDLLDLHLEGGDEAAWARPGLDRRVLRDLRRGRWVIQAQLDLHGCDRNGARSQLAAFLNRCLAAGGRCVRIVHGKGLGSPGREPVLKKLVHGWLTQRSEVLAFCQARAAEGGAGAVVVLLKEGR
jgi:DNA-nicking Smr family endonuclease